MGLSAGDGVKPDKDVELIAGDLVPRMVRVTVAMAGSGAIVIALAAVRSKFVALELGPHGVGSLTLLISLIAFAGVVFGLGLGTGAVREIAAAEAEHRQRWRDQVRAALYALSLLLALVAAAVIALFAGPIADALGSGGLDDEIRLCAIVVAAALVGAAAEADLNGFRRVRTLATIRPLAALIATIAAGVAWLAGADLLAVVLLAPTLAATVIAIGATRSLPRVDAAWSLEQLTRPARSLIHIGIPFALNSLLATAGALLLRVLIEADLGLSGVGEFQAAFAIATYYLSFIFAALATEYLPLLSGIAADEVRLNQAANNQLFVAILISAPLVMLMIAGAPMVISLLYSRSFEDSPVLLQLMLLGELTRIAAWTLGYILVARTARRMFVGTELLYNVLLIGATAGLIPIFGIKGTAVAYLVGQVGSLLWTLVFVDRVSNFRLTRTNALNLIGYGAAAGIVCAAAAAGGLVALLGWAVALATAAVAIITLLRHLPDGSDRLRRLLRMQAGAIV
jgi:enterobacterial common antigen flippase